MPTPHTERVDGFKLFVRAQGIRRFCSILPYFSGNSVRLQIGVDRPLNTPLKFEYRLARWDMNMRCANSNILGEEGKRIIDNIQSGNKDLFNRRLFINGKHTLHIKYEYNGRESNEIVFFEFNLRDKDISMERLLIGLVGAIIGGLIGLLTRILN